jgi:hypothetical protein
VGQIVNLRPAVNLSHYRAIGDVRRKLKYRATIFNELEKGTGEFRQFGREVYLNEENS